MESLFNIYFKSKRDYLKNWFVGSSKFAIYKYLTTLRKIEKLNKRRKIALYFLKKRIRKYSVKTCGYQIPQNTLGDNPHFCHLGPIVINEAAKIGANAYFHGTVVIGDRGTAGIAPIIGDNCSFGAGCQVLGGITLGNNITIGAGAIVIHSFPDNSVLVGVPAKNVSNKKI